MPQIKTNNLNTKSKHTKSTHTKIQHGVIIDHSFQAGSYIQLVIHHERHRGNL